MLRSDWWDFLQESTDPDQCGLMWLPKSRRDMYMAGNWSRSAFELRRRVRASMTGVNMEYALIFVIKFGGTRTAVSWNLGYPLSVGHFALVHIDPDFGSPHYFALIWTCALM